MRKLNLNDAFKAAEIIRKAKIREELAELLADSGKQGQMKLGASVVLMLIERLRTCRRSCAVSSLP